MCAVLGGGWAAAQTPAQAPAQKPAVDRWEADIRKFEAADKVGPPHEGGVVFVGSSSIVRWNVNEAFPELGSLAINRGFGGSLIGDSTRYADRIVIPYKPRLVVFYAGDNDLVTDATPAQIADQFAQFAVKVRRALPKTRIIFVSIKPSLQRWAHIDKARAANALVRRYCAADPLLTYLDIETPMLGSDGRPRPELFVQDGLHLSAEGYRIWNAALRPLLR